MRTVSVQLAGLDTPDKHMPVVKCTMMFRVQINDARRSRIVGMIEQEQLEIRAVAREDTEVYALGVYCCAKRVSASMPYIRFQAFLLTFGKNCFVQRYNAYRNALCCSAQLALPR